MNKRNTEGTNRAPDAEELHTFFEDPSTDVMISTIVSLTAELAVTRERLDTLERLLEKQSVIARSAIEQFSPDARDSAERMTLRKQLFDKVMGKLERYFSK